jgi:hypothetical protein
MNPGVCGGCGVCGWRGGVTVWVGGGGSGGGGSTVGSARTKKIQDDQIGNEASMPPCTLPWCVHLSPHLSLLAD